MFQRRMQKRRLWLWRREARYKHRRLLKAGALVFIDVNVPGALAQRSASEAATAPVNGHKEL